MACWKHPRKRRRGAIPAALSSELFIQHEPLAADAARGSDCRQSRYFVIAKLVTDEPGVAIRILRALKIQFF
jgi:hypothetical protein